MSTKQLEEHQYVICDIGEIWSKKNQQFIKKSCKTITNPFYYFKAYVPECKTFNLATVIAEKFVPNPDELKYVHHKDKNRFNCHSNNLEWNGKQQREFVESIPIEYVMPKLNEINPAPKKKARKGETIVPSETHENTFVDIDSDNYKIIKNLEEQEYVICKEGEIWSNKTKLFLKKIVNDSSSVKFYQFKAQVLIDGNIKCNRYNLATIIATKFVPNPDNLKFLYYKDNNRYNCHKDNLLWNSKTQTNFVESYEVKYELPKFIEDDEKVESDEKANDIIDVFSLDDIDNVNAYRIDRDGKIWSNISNRFLKEWIYNGYKGVQLKNKYFAVHRLVALKYIPNPDNKPYVNHINEDKLDNQLSNLEWCTQKENCAKHSKDISHPKRIIQYDISGNEITRFNSLLEGAESISLTYGAITKVLRGKNKTAGGFIWKYEDPLNESIIADLTNAKLVDGYKNYYIFPDGRVYNKYQRCFLVPNPTDNIYTYVQLCNRSDKKQNEYIHRLVAKAFIPNDDPITKTQVNHKDKKRNNNNVENLEWVTPSENNIHAKSFVPNL